MSSDSHWHTNLSDHLFWDINIDSFDPKKHLRWLLSRVVSYGYLKDWQLLKSSCAIEDIKREAVLIKSMNKKDLNFLSKALNIPINNFKCYTQIQSTSTHWNY